MAERYALARLTDVIWIFLVLVAVAVVAFFLRRPPPRPAPEASAPPSGAKESTLEHHSRPSGPPPSGAADPLENMKAALDGMELDDLENMLDMGATLKPGVKELIETEIRRRESED